MERRADRAAVMGEPLEPALRAEAQAIWDEDRAMCERIGELGAPLIPAGATVGTICNAGVLATGGIGTALAPIYHLHRAGRGPQRGGAGDPAAAPGQPAHRLGAEPRRRAVHRSSPTA